MVRHVAQMLLFAAALGCKRTPPPPPDEAPPPVAPTTTVPPVAAAASSPPAVAPEGTPLERARAYEAAGQLWLARLTIETHALSPEAAPEETTLLGRVCRAQSDAECVAACERRLGKKSAYAAAAPSAPPIGEHREPDTDLARARQLFLEGRDAEGRALLEPRVLDGRGGRAEALLLKEICQRQGDRMCVALCAAKAR